MLITDIISISYNDIEYKKWYFDTFSSKNKLTCMNHINLANHLQNLIYYKDEYRLFYPRTPADIRHNITEYYTKWKTYLSESLLYPMSSSDVMAFGSSVCMKQMVMLKSIYWQRRYLSLITLKFYHVRNIEDLNS